MNRPVYVRSSNEGAGVTFSIDTIVVTNLPQSLKKQKFPKK